MTVTISNTRHNVTGHKRVVVFNVAAGWATADTITAPLSVITDMQWSPNSSSYDSSADKLNVSYSGNTITLTTTAGVARALDIRVEGQ